MAHEDKDRSQSGSRNASAEVDEIASKLDDLQLSSGGNPGEASSDDAAGDSDDSRDDTSEEPRAMQAQTEREREEHPLPDSGGPDEPDVLLDAPEVSIDELDLTLDELEFDLALQAKEAGGERQPGASVHLGQVELHVKGVMAEAHLQMDLRDLTETIRAAVRVQGDAEGDEGEADEGAREEEADEADGEETSDAGAEKESALGSLFNEEGTIVEEALGEAVDLGVEEKLIERNGSWYAYGDETIGQGREAVVDWFRENEEARMALAEQLRFREAAEAGEPLITERTDDEGRTVRRVRDPSGSVTFEYVLDDDEVKSLNVVEA